MALRPYKGDLVLFPNGSSAAIKYVVEDDAVVHLMNGQIVLLKDLSLSPDENQNLWVFTWVFTGHSLSPHKITNGSRVGFPRFAGGSTYTLPPG
jgi:hypothetical protein